ncbi:MAG: inositol monophosphatase family protein [Pseudomonadota bacterium]
MIDAAISAARLAGDIIRAAAADPASLQVRTKQPNDFVTQVDLASQQAIVRTLLAAHPKHAVRSEESLHAFGAPGAEHVWIVDPLDGTTNFIHGYPVYAVSIALAVRGRVELGVVLDVTRDDLYHAGRGSGAFCNGRRLQVASRSGLGDAVVATSCPYRPGPTFASSMQMLGAVMAGVRAIRRSGSAALDLAAVAAGHCDAAFDLGLNAWDVAAGGLLVSEAGGVVSRFRGEPDFLESRECLAGNPAVHAALGAILRPFATGRDPLNGHGP